MVLDGRLPLQRALQVVHLAGRLGLSRVWWRQPPHLGPQPADLGSLLDGLITAAGSLPVGVMADDGAAQGDGDDMPVLPARPGRRLDRELAALAAQAGGRPVLVEVCVSIGRTTAEAAARADGEALFALLGHPSEQGLFGSLEQCQQAAGRLWQSGARELACNLPLAIDIADVLAQLRAVTVAGAASLGPGEPASPAPAPPTGWGGRPGRRV